MEVNDLLRSLSDHEHQLYSYVSSLQGTMEHKEQHLRENGIFAAYRQLHARYLTAFHDSTDNSSKLELLKRLLFINWYYLAEPSCFTGINDLDETVILATYSIIDEYLRYDKLDAELRWMLAYYATWDYSILAFIDYKLAVLTAYIKEHDTISSAIPYQQLPKHSMDYRGQMGRYWQSVGIEQL
jgi:hypothetical protein